MTRALDWLELLLMFILVLVLVAIVSFMSMQVVNRYLFGHPLVWTEEVSRHLMIWLVFLGAALVYRRGTHIGITLLPERLPPTGRMLVQLLAAIILGLFFCLMTIYGWELVERTMQQRTSALRYPMGYAYAALPASGALMILFTIEHIVRIITRRGVGTLPEHRHGGE